MLGERSMPGFRSGGPFRAAAAFVVLAVAAAIGAATSAVPLAAQTAAKPAQEAPAPPNPQPWSINCNGQGPAGALVCVMTQGLIAKNTGQRVLSVAIAKTPAGAYSATLSLPHGLNLPEGVQVWIDEGQRAKHAITTADQNGSYAIVPLDQAMIGSMKKGTILNVLVKSASGDEVTFQLSLNGFTAALERV
jgi:invasion protein IalB